jgi:hypothetical protein
MNTGGADRPLTPQEKLAIAEQSVQRMTHRLERAFRRLRYLIFGQWVLIALWVLANHFWK